MTLRSAGYFVVVSLIAAMPVINTVQASTSQTITDMILYPRADNHSADIAQYSTGLTGVNFTRDNISSRILYGTIGLLLLMIFGLRLFQRANAHIRHLTSFDATPIQQNYWRHDSSTWLPWLKRHLVWAPIGQKRHHRELQLSSAHNMGTIPSRLQTLILGLYLGSNITYCLLLDYHTLESAQAVAEFRGRTGHLCVLNMVALFILPARNNPFSTLLKISFDTFNLFHRWIGRVVILEAIMHTIAWLINKHTALGWDGVRESLRQDPFLYFGMISTCCFTIILFQACSPVRHAAYETFLAIHQVLAFLALIGIAAHAQLGPLPQIPFVIAIFCIWGYDRVLRVFKFVSRNFTLRRGCTKVVIEALPADACRVTFHLPRQWTPPPGAHAYAYLPAVSFWQSHPFSIAWSEQASSRHGRKSSVPKEKLDAFTPSAFPSSVSMVMSARSGMTRNLYMKARAQPGNTLLTTGFLEGPYGALESLHSYGTVLLFAGGVGITHMLPYIRELLVQRHNRTCAIRKLVLVWSIRERAMLEWVRPWMEQILAMEERKDVLSIKMFVTRPKRPDEVVSPSPRVQMFGGRPQVEATVWETFDARVGAMCVGVCGPGALADDVRHAARAAVCEGKVDFWEEGFTW